MDEQPRARVTMHIDPKLFWLMRAILLLDQMGIQHIRIVRLDEMDD